MIEMQCVLLFAGTPPTEEELEEQLDCTVIELVTDEVAPRGLGSDGEAW